MLEVPNRAYGGLVGKLFDSDQNEQQDVDSKAAMCIPSSHISPQRLHLTDD
jgi:hypothetical protein